MDVKSNQYPAFLWQLKLCREARRPTFSLPAHFRENAVGHLSSPGPPQLMDLTRRRRARRVERTDRGRSRLSSRPSNGGSSLQAQAREVELLRGGGVPRSSCQANFILLGGHPAGERAGTRTENQVRRRFGLSG